MTRVYNLTSSLGNLANRFHARMLGFSKPATGFLRQPEPRSIGSYQRGLQLKAGNIMFAGHLIEAPRTNLWDIAAPDFGFAHEAHGFGWLDDLASVGDKEARTIIQSWVQTWINRYGRGGGAGWMPDITGRRLIRWIHHGFMILRGIEPSQSELFFQSLGRQTVFLSRRWLTTSPGLPRFEALAGLIYAGLTLEGMESYVRPATSALARECRTQIDENGAIPTRNPEELLEVFSLLAWAVEALRGADWIPSQAHLDALDRIAPTLRLLRHSDGSLARFHGGGKGIEGRLDQALALSGNKSVARDRLAMGFGRLSEGRTTVIMDVAPLPLGRASLNAHASTLAVELTSGRCPLLVNAGPGARFGADWMREGRQGAAHSTLTIEGASTARFGKPMPHTIRKSESLIDGPSHVPFEWSESKRTQNLQAGHNGFMPATGLTHVRKLQLSFDGSTLDGEDLLIAIEPRDKKQFDAAFERTGLQGIGYEIRFHLHPDITPTVDMGGMAVSMSLANGEIWVFRHNSPAELSLELSTYFDSARIKPRKTHQIVLSHRAMEYATRVRWSLKRVVETDILSHEDLDALTGII